MADLRGHGVSGMRVPSVRFLYCGRESVPETAPLANDKKQEFAYDYRGRRVRKLVYNYSGGWQPQSDRRFVWDDWNPVMVLDGLACNGECGTGVPPVVRKYTWGLDLSGLAGRGAGVSPANGLHAAGGIGGLLAAYDTAATTTTSDDRTFLYTYDANGNVGQLTETTPGANYGTLAAKYEYDPYGNAIVASGTYATANPYRFSTKPFDGPTGQGYWGYRWYDPRLGRWTTRDPIEEKGGWNLYGFVRNNSISRIDPVGKIAPIVIGVAVVAGYGAGCTYCAAHHKEDVYNEHVGKDDAFLHCVTVCRLKRYCPPGTATLGSVAQEIPPKLDWKDDLIADHQGIRCGSFLGDRNWNESCESCCEKHGFPPHGRDEEYRSRDAARDKAP